MLDGVQFLDRPYFLDPACYAWRVVGARGFASIEHQLVVRVERFQVPADPGDIEHVYHAAVAQAASRGLTAVWLAEDRDDGLAPLVYFIDRVDPPDPTTPDFASLGALAGAPALGDAVAPASWTRIFDRTSWVLTDWFPYAFADRGRPSLWPYSPPFPAPSCGDGVCEPSRGETGASCPADCAVHCGDGVCQPSQGETDDNCPSDCRLPDQRGRGDGPPRRRRIRATLGGARSSPGGRHPCTPVLLARRPIPSNRRHGGRRRGGDPPARSLRGGAAVPPARRRRLQRAPLPVTASMASSRASRAA